MTRAKWDELVAWHRKWDENTRAEKPEWNPGYDADPAILWADKVVKIATRAVMLHSHASIYCTQCFVDAVAVKELRDALEAR